jgi:hypothetical protein
VCDACPVYMVEFWESSTQKRIVPELLSSSGTLLGVETLGVVVVVELLTSSSTSRERSSSTVLYYI